MRKDLNQFTAYNAGQEDAMKNRARLQALCPTSCTELRELDRAIADHKAAGGQST